MADYALHPYNWPLQGALISLLQARLNFPVLADSLGSRNYFSSGPWPWNNLAWETQQWATAPNNTVSEVTGIHKPPQLWWGGSRKFPLLITVEHQCQEWWWEFIYSWLKAVSFPVCQSSSLGIGWGACISGSNKTNGLLCAGASWSGSAITWDASCTVPSSGILDTSDM